MQWYPSTDSSLCVTHTLSAAGTLPLSPLVSAAICLSSFFSREDLSLGLLDFGSLDASTMAFSIMLVMPGRSSKPSLTMLAMGMPRMRLCSDFAASFAAICCSRKHWITGCR